MINNLMVYGLGESLVASGYPMETEIEDDIDLEDWTGQPFRRGKKLGNTPAGSGHGNYLKGIIVQFDWRNSIIIQRQILRYNFIDIVSSQSTMHKALSMSVAGQCNDYVHPQIIAIVQGMIDNYNEVKKSPDKEMLKELELEILYNLPSGYELTARFTTNYLQLKTMYNQRKHHKLPEWKEFCKWCLTLPSFEALTGVA